MPGNSAAILSRVPNSLFDKSHALSHSSSVSLHQTVSPVGLSIAQHHAQLADQTVETAMSIIGQVA